MLFRSMPFRDDQTVPPRHGKAVADPERMSVLPQDTLRRQRTEWTRLGRHFTSPHQAPKRRPIVDGLQVKLVCQSPLENVELRLLAELEDTVEMEGILCLVRKIQLVPTDDESGGMATVRGLDLNETVLAGRSCERMS